MKRSRVLGERHLSKTYRIPAGLRGDNYRHANKVGKSDHIATRPNALQIIATGPAPCCGATWSYRVGWRNPCRPIELSALVL